MVKRLFTRQQPVHVPAHTERNPLKSLKLLTRNVYKYLSDASCIVGGGYEAEADVEVTLCFKFRVANVLFICLLACLLLHKLPGFALGF